MPTERGWERIGNKDLQKKTARSWTDCPGWEQKTNPEARIQGRSLSGSSRGHDSSQLSALLSWNFISVSTSVVIFTFSTFRSWRGSDLNIFIHSCDVGPPRGTFPVLDEICLPFTCWVGAHQFPLPQQLLGSLQPGLPAGPTHTPAGWLLWLCSPSFLCQRMLIA